MTGADADADERLRDAESANEAEKEADSTCGDAAPGVPASASPLEHPIFTVRGRRVMLDADLAAVYRVLPKRLNQQVRRNRARFPRDFAFQLTAKEATALRLQTATSKRGRGGRRGSPWAFTEHGAVMLASVLRSPVAIDASIQVVRAFVRLRAMAVLHKELGEKLDALEAKYDEQFRAVFEAVRQLMAPAPKSHESRIGFRATKGL